MAADDATGCSVLPRGRKTRALLAILALSPNRTALRSQLTALLWSRRGMDQGRASLRQAVHELQQALQPLGPHLLHTDRNHLALAETGVWTDAAAFLRATPSHPDPLALFHLPLVGDLQGLDPAFDRWCAQQAERLLLLARKCGESVLAGQSEPSALLRAAGQLLRIERTHQGAWRAMIGAYLDQGDHAAALAAYEQCRSALAQSGTTPPSRDTEALAARIRRPAATPGPSATPGRGPGRGTTPRGSGAGLARASGSRGDSAVRLGVLPLRQVEQGRKDALALALAEEITAALAQFRWITCIASAGATSEAVGDEVGLHHLPQPDFLLDGTLQQRGNRVRVIVRLSDLRAGGTVVWAHRFDRDLADIFALQDDIAAETAAQIDTALLLWEGERAYARRQRDPDALELMLGAIPSIYRLEKHRFRKAGDQLETSLALDPGNAAAHAWLAYWHLFLVGQGWAPDAVAATRRAAELAERAVGLDARDARAITLAGHVRGFLSKQPDEARALHERAIALNPNLALAWCFSGLAHSYLGDHAEATRRLSHAQRLAPHDPHGFFFDTAQIMPYLLRREFATAAMVGRRALALNPGFSSACKGLLSALGHLRREREAAELCQRLLTLEPGFSVHDAITRCAMVREEDVALYAAGLRLAGLPE